jgi:hypothetical protein
MGRIAAPRGLRPGRGWPTALTAGLLAVAVWAACGGSGPVARGFGSREVMPIRDPSFIFAGLTNGAGDLTAFYETQAPGATARSYWSVDVATGEVTNLGTAFPESFTLFTGRYLCGFFPDGGPDGSGTLQILDIKSGAQTNIGGVVAYAACPQDDGSLFVFRADPTTGSPSLWTGSFDALEPIDLALDVQAVGSWLFDSSQAPSGVLVAGAKAAQPNAFGLYTIALDSYAISEDVPPTPASTAWATGAAAAGSLQSTSLAIGTAQAIRPMGDHFLYSRTMSDGGTTMFVGPFSSGPASELALFQANADVVSTSNVSLYGSSNAIAALASASIAGWSAGSTAGMPAVLMVWDDAAKQLISCPWSAGASAMGVLSADGAHALFIEPPGSAYGATASPAALLSLPGAQNGTDACASLASANAQLGNFSPDSKALYWTVVVGGETQLWVAASDGTNARMVPTATILYAYFVSDSEKLEIDLDGDLVWVDLQDDPLVQHDIVEQVFGLSADISGSWSVILYDYSTQDGTGLLGVVNRDTDEKRLISPDVADFELVAEPPSSDGGSGGTIYDVVYLVRGRNPSPQDGLWMSRVSSPPGM